MANDSAMNDEPNRSSRTWSEELWFVHDDVWPTPDVQEQAGPVWWTVWMVYCVSAGGLFLLVASGGLALMLLNQCLEQRRRRRIPPLLLAVHVCLLPFGVMSSLCIFAPMLTKASHTNRSTVHIFTHSVRLVDFMARVLLMSAYAFLLSMVLKVTRMNLGTKRMSNSLSVLLCFALIALIGVCVHFIVQRRHTLKHLIILPQLMQVTAALICCLVFVYKGFKIAQFMLDTNTMFYEILAYEKLKREVTEQGTRRDLALCRLRRLMWTSEHEGPAELLQADLKRDSLSSDASHERSTDPRKQDCLSGGRPGHQLFCTMHQRNGRVRSDNIKRRSSDSSNLSADCETPTTTLFSLDEAFTDECSRGSVTHPEPPLPNGHAPKETSASRDEGKCLKSFPPNHKANSTREMDRGYMADSEVSSPSQSPSRIPPAHSTQPTIDYSQHWLGLKQIKQGRLLSRILKSMYFSTLFLFIGALLRLYDVFGVYGVLGNEAYVAPWPWLIFQACDRFCELVVGITLLHGLLRLRRPSLKDCSCFASSKPAGGGTEHELPQSNTLHERLQEAGSEENGLAMTPC